MRQRILSCMVAANLTLTILSGTAGAGFADPETASMSLTAGRVEMRLSETGENGLSSDMSLIVVNEGTVNADLWLENLYRQQNDATEPEINDLPEIDAGGDFGSVTVEVAYKSAVSSIILNDLYLPNAPCLLLEDMEPGSDAIVTIRQSAGSQPDTIEEFPANDSAPNGQYKSLSIPVPYIFEFILKSGTFTSLVGESVSTLIETYVQFAESDKPAVESEETPETQAAGDKAASETAVGDTAASSGSPDEARPENSAEPADVTAVPEPTDETVQQLEKPEETEALPSIPDLTESEG